MYFIAATTTAKASVVVKTFPDYWNVVRPADKNVQQWRWDLANKAVVAAAFLIVVTSMTMQLANFSAWKFQLELKSATTTTATTSLIKRCESCITISWFFFDMVTCNCNRAKYDMLATFFYKLWRKFSFCVRMIIEIEQGYHQEKRLLMTECLSKWWSTFIWLQLDWSFANCLKKSGLIAIFAVMQSNNLPSIVFTTNLQQPFIDHGGSRAKNARIPVRNSCW